MCVQYIGVSFSAPEKYEYIRGYLELTSEARYHDSVGFIHKYTGGCSVHGKYFKSTSGSLTNEYIDGYHNSYQGMDIMSTLGVPDTLS